MNLVVSNVPGPPVPLYLAGAPLLEVFPLLPPMGNLTLVVAAVSYAGQLNLTAAVDRDSCPDVEVFARGMHSALADLERSVPGFEERGPAAATESSPQSVGEAAIGGGPMMGHVRSDGCDLYYEEAGEGVPILLIHPAGHDGLDLGPGDRGARPDRTSDHLRPPGLRPHPAANRCARSPRIPPTPPRSWSHLRTPPAVVVGTSAGAAIAVDLAVRRPDLVRAVVAHEFPWRLTPSPSYRVAGRGAGQDRIARPTRPTERRRRDAPARRLQLP